MSLVGDALRKARQHGAAGRPPGAVVPPSLVLPPRRYRSGIGLAPLLLIAVAAGLGGAAGVWWAVGRQRPSPAAAPAATPAADGQAAASPAAAPAATALPRPAAAAGPATQAPALDTPETAAAAAALAAAPPATPHAEPEPDWTGERRTRDVLIDADLGYAKLHLDYLVYRRGSPFGRVNGKDVIVGSIVDGFTVEEITADYIKLSDRRNTVILRVR